MPLSAIGYAFSACGLMLAYYAIATNIALHLEYSDLVDSKQWVSSHHLRQLLAHDNEYYPC